MRMKQINKTIYDYSSRYQFHSVEHNVTNVRAHPNSDPISLIYFYFKNSSSYLVFFQIDNSLIIYPR